MHSHFAMEKRLGRRETTFAGSKAVLKQSCETTTSSSSQTSTPALACFVSSANTNSRTEMFASPKQHQTSSWKNSMHCQCRRPWRIATHAQLGTPTPQELFSQWRRRIASANMSTPHTRADSTSNARRQPCVTTL